MAEIIKGKFVFRYDGQKRKAVAAAAAVCVIAMAAMMLSSCGGYSYIRTEDGERIRISQTENSVDLSGEDIKSLAPLRRIDGLEILDLSGAKANFSALAKLTSLTELNISNTGYTDVKVLSNLTSLKKLDMTGNELSEAQFESLQAALPDCEIIWDVPFMGGRVSSTAAELVLDDTAAEQDFENVKYFTDCTYIDAQNCTNYDALLRLWNEMPECEILWKYDLFGHELTSLSTEADLRDCSFETNVDLLEQLRYLPSLTYCDMCGCGLSNEQMDELRAAYPDIKFVWYIQFAHWTVRTDITCFSTLNGHDGRFSDEVFAPLFKYCTDLVALDIGHHGLSDLEPIRNLTKLKYLILADNYISDISPLADLKELVYLELFLNRDVEDLTPLKSLTKMVDINLCHIYVGSNYDFLYSMPDLKLVYLNMCRVPFDEHEALFAEFPDVRIVTVLGTHSCTFGGWRHTERNRGVVGAFQNWEKVKEFRNWDDIEYWEDGESSGTRRYGLRGYSYYDSNTRRTYSYNDPENNYRFSDWQTSEN